MSEGRIRNGKGRNPPLHGLTAQLPGYLNWVLDFAVVDTWIALWKRRSWGEREIWNFSSPTVFCLGKKKGGGYFCWGKLTDIDTFPSGVKAAEDCIISKGKKWEKRKGFKVPHHYKAILATTFAKEKQVIKISTKEIYGVSWALCKN